MINHTQINRGQRDQFHGSVRENEIDLIIMMTLITGLVGNKMRGPFKGSIQPDEWGVKSGINR